MTDWLDDDDRLLTLLGDALAEADPVPERVLAAARDTFTWADPDAALAELIFDSATASAGVRSTPVSARHLIFQAPGVEIEIMISDNGGREVVGQLVPPCDAVIELHHERGETQQTTTDELGRFTFSVPRAARTQLTVRTDGNVATTPWFDIE